MKYYALAKDTRWLILPAILLPFIAFEPSLSATQSSRLTSWSGLFSVYYAGVLCHSGRITEATSILDSWADKPQLDSNFAGTEQAQQTLRVSHEISWSREREYLEKIRSERISTSLIAEIETNCIYPLSSLPATPVALARDHSDASSYEDKIVEKIEAVLPSIVSVDEGPRRTLQTNSLPTNIAPVVPNSLPLSPPKLIQANPEEPEETQFSQKWGGTWVKQNKPSTAPPVYQDLPEDWIARIVSRS